MLCRTFAWKLKFDEKSFSRLPGSARSILGYNSSGACKAAGVLKALECPGGIIRTIKRSGADKVSLGFCARESKCKEENNCRG